MEKPIVLHPAPSPALPALPSSFLRLLEFYREQLDYSYHQHYPLHRRLLQAQIVFKTVNMCAVSQGKRTGASVAVYMAGAMGSGKSTLIQWLVNTLWPWTRDETVVVDMDEIRSQLGDEGSAGGFCEVLQREAACIAELLLRYSIDFSLPVIVDGTLRDRHWHRQQFARLRCSRPDLSLVCIHVSAQTSIIAERVRHRAVKTGRFVSRAALTSILHLNDVAFFDDLREDVDLLLQVDASHAEPLLRQPSHMSWDSFARYLAQIAGSEESLHGPSTADADCQATNVLYEANDYVFARSQRATRQAMLQDSSPRTSGCTTAADDASCEMLIYEEMDQDRSQLHSSNCSEKSDEGDKEGGQQRRFEEEIALELDQEETYAIYNAEAFILSISQDIRAISAEISAAHRNQECILSASHDNGRSRRANHEERPLLCVGALSRRLRARRSIRGDHNICILCSLDKTPDHPHCTNRPKLSYPVVSTLSPVDNTNE